MKTEFVKELSEHQIKITSDLACLLFRQVGEVVLDGEHPGYELRQSTTGQPLIYSRLTGKTASIPWPWLLKAAIEAGIDAP